MPVRSKPKAPFVPRRKAIVAKAKVKQGNVSRGPAAKTKVKPKPQDAAPLEALPFRSSRAPNDNYSTPLPVRITYTQYDYLSAKRDKTGVPIQELVRRAIDHMQATIDIAVVPERL